MNTRAIKGSIRHAAAYPVPLAEWLIRLVTPPGGVVLDPFVGSGTTVVAARNVGCIGIGIERLPEYVETARRRLEDGATLFDRAEAAQ